MMTHHCQPGFIIAAHVTGVLMLNQIKVVRVWHPVWSYNWSVLVGELRSTQREVHGGLHAVSW
jgi:hypothetical protein